MESVSSAASDVDWPAVGSFNDCSNRSFKCIFEVDRRSRTSFLVPSQSRQILLFRFQIKFKRLTCHSVVAHAPSGEHRSRGSSSLSRIELLRGDGGSLLAKRLPRFCRPCRPSSRLEYQRGPRALSRVGERFLEQFLGFLHHELDFIPELCGRMPLRQDRLGE
jgi:hypothetical protein